MTAMTEEKKWWKISWVNNLIWILVILIVFFGVRAWKQQAMPKGLAPVFVGETVSGKKISLADYRGKPVMLYFWASWCKICEFEQGSIMSIAEDHPVLGVALRSGNSMQLGKYMQEHNFSITTIVDEFGDISDQYGVRGTPSVFFIDADGQIRSIEVGFTSETGMRIRLWLAGI